MPGERRTNVIDAMNLSQLQNNKATLAYELRIEANKPRNTAGIDLSNSRSIGGALTESAKTLSRLVTVTPSMWWKGSRLDVDATDISRVLVGPNSLWSEEARELAAALVHTNKCLKSIEDKEKKAQEQRDIEEVKNVETQSRLKEIYSNNLEPATAEEYYMKMLYLAKESRTKENDEAWLTQQKKWLDSIDPSMKSKIIEYGLQNNRYETDFRGGK